MSTGTGLNVSKALAYAVLTTPSGLVTTKANAYAVLTTPPGLVTTKANAYAVLTINNSYPPVWPNFTFANGMVGLPFSQQWDMPGSGSPITYSLQSGTLPPGLSLSSSATAGTLSGTPTAAGLYTFALKGTNVYGSASASFTMTVTLPSGNYGFIN